MKVLITGGAGFIGSHVAERCLEQGDDVLVIDNYRTGRRDTLEAHDRLRVVEGTIADGELVDRIFDEFGPQRVVHAAASYKDPDDWAEDARTNVLGTSNIVQASQRSKVERLIYFQTALCYGLKPEEQPIRLSYRLDPRGSSYAITKTAGEHLIALSGLPFCSFRLANAYGPRNLSGPLPTFFQRLTTGKRCFVMNTRRDFMFVDDVVEVVMKSLAGVGEGGYYHISTGSDYAIKELFDATVSALGVTLDEAVEVRARGEDDAETILLDPSKTEAEFSWKATIPLTTGIERAIAWYRERGLQETHTHLRMPDEE